MKDAFSPKILQCCHFVLKSPIKNKRFVKDYEFDFYLGGSREMYIDNRYHKISKGSLVFRKPGQTVESIGDYNAYMLTLDFSNALGISQDKYIRNRDTSVQSLCHNEYFNNIPEVFFPKHQEDIFTLLKKLIDCCYPNIINYEMQQKLVTELMFLILYDAHIYNREQDEITHQNESYVEKACTYINKEYKKPINLDNIANYLSINKNYLIRLFKKDLSITPNQYILNTRLFYAQRMLLHTNEPIENISFACGFNSTSYFIKCFKEVLGITPNIYRKNKTN